MGYHTYCQGMTVRAVSWGVRRPVSLTRDRRHSVGRKFSSKSYGSWRPATNQINDASIVVQGDGLPTRTF